MKLIIKVCCDCNEVVGCYFETSTIAKNSKCQECYYLPGCGLRENTRIFDRNQGLCEPCRDIRVA